jgi:hypothetical protein
MKYIEIVCTEYPMYKYLTPQESHKSRLIKKMSKKYRNQLLKIQEKINTKYLLLPKVGLIVAIAIAVGQRGNIRERQTAEAPPCLARPDALLSSPGAQLELTDSPLLSTTWSFQRVTCHPLLPSPSPRTYPRLLGLGPARLHFNLTPSCARLQDGVRTPGHRPAEWPSLWSPATLSATACL